jgi:hydrogenase maturation protein HypF
MAGGETAIRNPWRLALGYVYTLTDKVPILHGAGHSETQLVRQQLDRRLNTPLTSAAGRLFDAVAALIGLRTTVTYEGQAAIELEMLATERQKQEDALQPYPFDLEQGDGRTVIRLRRLFEAIQADLDRAVSRAEIGWHFHGTMAEMILSVCQQIGAKSDLRTVALSGGCFQNRLLMALTVPRLEEAGFRVLLHRQVPCNDGGISLGQAALARFASLERQAGHEVP